jgi:hypothetical protein
VDPNNVYEEGVTVYTTHATGTSSNVGWVGGTAWAGKLYAAPFNAGKFLKFDTATATLTLLTPSCMTTVGSDWGDGVAVNGLLYFAPMKSRYVLRFNTSDDTCALVHDTGDEGQSKWWGAGRVGHNVYFAPYSKEPASVLKLDTTTGVATLLNVSVTGGGWWQSGTGLCGVSLGLVLSGFLVDLSVVLFSVVQCAIAPPRATSLPCFRARMCFARQALPWATACTLRPRAWTMFCAWTARRMR